MWTAPEGSFGAATGTSARTGRVVSAVATVGVLARTADFTCRRIPKGMMLGIRLRERDVNRPRKRVYGAASTGIPRHVRITTAGFCRRTLLFDGAHHVSAVVYAP